MTVRHDPVEPRLVRADRSMIPGHVGGTIRSASLVRPRSDLAQPFGGAAGSSVGGGVAAEWVWLERRATQSMASGGADIAWDTEITDPPRQGFSGASFLPTTTLSVSANALVRVLLWVNWQSYTGGGAVQLVRIRGGVETVIWEWPPPLTGQYFAGPASLPFVANDQIRVRVVQTSGAAQTLGFARLVIEALPAGGAVPEGADVLTPSYVAATSAEGESIGYPAGIQSGDLLVLYAGSQNQAHVVPSGWRRRFYYDSGMPYASIIFRTVDGSETGSVIVTGALELCMAAFRDADGLEVLGNEANNRSGVNQVTPPVESLTNRSGAPAILTCLWLMSQTSGGDRIGQAPAGLTEIAHVPAHGQSEFPTSLLVAYRDGISDGAATDTYQPINSVGTSGSRRAVPLLITGRRAVRTPGRVRADMPIVPVTPASATTFTIPAEAAGGDLIVVFAGLAGATAAPTITGATFTLLRSVTMGTGSLHAWYRVLAASDAGVTCTLSTAANALHTVTRRGMATSPIVDHQGAASMANVTEITLPALTAEAGGVIVACAWNYGSSGNDTWSPLGAPWTDLTAYPFLTDHAQHPSYAVEQAGLTAGSVGPTTFTGTGASNNQRGVIGVSLRRA